MRLRFAVLGTVLFFASYKAGTAPGVDPNSTAAAYLLVVAVAALIGGAWMWIIALVPNSSPTQTQRPKMSADKKLVLVLFGYLVVAAVSGGWAYDNVCTYSAWEEQARGHVDCSIGVGGVWPVSLLGILSHRYLSPLLEGK